MTLHPTPNAYADARGEVREPAAPLFLTSRVRATRVDRLDFSERYAEFIPRADLCLLKWVGVSMNRATIRTADPARGVKV